MKTFIKVSPIYGILSCKGNKDFTLVGLRNLLRLTLDAAGLLWPYSPPASDSAQGSQARMEKSSPRGGWNFDGFWRIPTKITFICYWYPGLGCQIPNMLVQFTRYPVFSLSLFFHTSAMLRYRPSLSVRTATAARRYEESEVVREDGQCWLRW